MVSATGAKRTQASGDGPPGSTRSDLRPSWSTEASGVAEPRTAVQVELGFSKEAWNTGVAPVAAMATDRQQNRRCMGALPMNQDTRGRGPASKPPALRGRRGRRGWRRGGQRLLSSAMAGVAGDVLLAVGELSVDVLRQDDHLAGDVFFRVLVTGKIAFHVTEVALHAEAETEGLHGGPEIRGRDLQHFQILGRLGRPGLFGGGRRLLSAERDR